MDHHSKLDWAGGHIDALEKAVADFSDSKPCDVGLYYNDDAEQYQIRVDAIKAMPPDLGLMVGDIVHGLRSALDNLTYALACQRCGSGSADKSTRLQFPIADTPEAWAGTPKKPACQKDRIVLLSQAAQAEIERQQPCFRPDKTVPHFLSILRDLSNTDKHRRLVLTLIRASDVEILLAGSGIPAGTVVQSAFSGPIETDTILGGWWFQPGPRGYKPPDMKVQCNFKIDVEFGHAEPAPRQPVRGVLRYIRDHIRDDIFPPLDHLLT